MKRESAIVAMLLSLIILALVQAEPAHNPIIWADVPDVAVIRVGDTYYMSSTTMHMSPGLPIMKSKNLVNWEMLNYAYDRLVDNDAMNLENGQSAYGRGSWASCLRYHDGTYYATTFSATSGRTHMYTTRDIEKGDWKASSFSPSLHDHTLFFDDDGRVYVIYGGGKLTLVELLPDLSGIKPGGVNKVIIENVNLLFGENEVGGLNGEGSQLTKVNGKYYLLNIASPKSRWSRSVLIHRADKITGPYEGRVALEDKGVAQGCLIDTSDGKWYAMLFQDNGSVGRTPWLVPVKWEDGWPVFGIDGKAPTTIDIEDDETFLDSNIVASDEFDRESGQTLPLAWQWNHNPDDRFWSIGQREGHLRLTTGRVDSDVLSARNMLTQRTFGPVCSATTKIDITHMKDGDCAGMIVLQRRYGLVGVKMEDGRKSIVMLGIKSDRPRQRGRRNQPSEPDEVESVPLTQSTVYLKIDCDFRDRTDKAYFYYSLDGETWSRIGSVLQMAYTLPHFMGYRFGLFNMATQTAGGYVDFDYYRVTDEITKPDSNFYVFLCFGQSNMEGFPGIETQDKAGVGPRLQVLSAVDIPNLDRTKGHWYEAVPPLCRDNSGLCPADYFGRTLVAKLPEHIRVGVINVSVAGCKIELFEKDTYRTYADTAAPWMKDIIKAYEGNPYQTLVDMARLAQQDGVIKGILLHQGESNTNDKRWPEKVKGIYDNLMKDLNLKAEEVPLLVGELVGADQGGVCASMNAIIAQLPQIMTNAHIVSSKGCAGRRDHLHFTPAGYRELGRHYAETILPLLGY